MILRTCLSGLAALLSGCIIFDQKSEAVAFHQFASPAVAPSAPGPQVFVPRAIVPSALRRLNVVLADDAGWVHIEDGHRWVAPLDRAIPEAVARHLTARTGLPTATQTPSAEYLVLLLTVDKMEVSAPSGADRSFFFLPGGAEKDVAATLQLTCRLEKADGSLVAAKTLARSQPLKERTADAFVRAQSANLAELSAELARWLPPAPPPSR